MAKFDLKFLCQQSDEDFIKVHVDEDYDIVIRLTENHKTNSIYLDKSTAIKFAKTLRTEINKIES